MMDIDLAVPIDRCSCKKEAIENSALYCSFTLSIVFNTLPSTTSNGINLGSLSFYQVMASVSSSTSIMCGDNYNDKINNSNMAPAQLMPPCSQTRHTSPPTFVPAVSAITYTPARRDVTVSRSLGQARTVAFTSISTSFHTEHLATTPSQFSSNRDRTVTGNIDANAILSTPATKQVVIPSTSTPSSAKPHSSTRSMRISAKKPTPTNANLDETPIATTSATSLTAAPEAAFTSTVPPPQKLCSPMILATLELGGEAITAFDDAATSAAAASKLQSLTVVTHVPMEEKASFVVRLFAMVHYSHVVSPDICSWVEEGTAVEVHSKHPCLGTLLSYFFQRM
jgi:hypothetical protein